MTATAVTGHGIEPAISLSGVHKVYGSGEGAVPALAGVDLDIPAGEYVAIMTYANSTPIAPAPAMMIDPGSWSVRICSS